MPRHNYSTLRGEVVETRIRSTALEGNLLGDPIERSVHVYLPAREKGDPERFPLLVYLASFTNSGLRMTGWKRFGESIPQRVERLRSEGRLGAVCIAFPDCFTSLGGNQYVDSAALGRWEAFLVGDLLPHLVRTFPVAASPGRRGILGFSSGGYGALVQGFRYGKEWGAVACHSGDVGFELLFPPLFPVAARQLESCDYKPSRLLEEFWEDPKIDYGRLEIINLLAMAASYDPDPDLPYGIRLPFRPETCQIIPERWARWLDHDPLLLAQNPDSLDSLTTLNALYFDCGTRDQYNLHFGARRLSQQLREKGVAHRYEEFDDTHSGIDYRLDTSLPFLYETLASV